MSRGFNPGSAPIFALSSKLAQDRPKFADDFATPEAPAVADDVTPGAPDIADQGIWRPGEDYPVEAFIAADALELMIVGGDRHQIRDISRGKGTLP